MPRHYASQVGPARLHIRIRCGLARRTEVRRHGAGAVLVQGIGRVSPRSVGGDTLRAVADAVILIAKLEERMRRAIAELLPAAGDFPAIIIAPGPLRAIFTSDGGALVERVVTVVRLEHFRIGGVQRLHAVETPCEVEVAQAGQRMGALSKASDEKKGNQSAHGTLSRTTYDSRCQR